MRQFYRFLREEVEPRGWTPYRTEWSIYDERRGVAGQIDCVFTSNGGTQYHMVDWKRCGKPLDPFANAFFGRYGRHPCNLMIDNACNHYVCQQNLYAEILRDCYQIQLTSMHLLQLHENQETYKMITVPRHLDIARAMLNICCVRLDLDMVGRIYQNIFDGLSNMAFEELHNEMHESQLRYGLSLIHI